MFGLKTPWQKDKEFRTALALRLGFTKHIRPRSVVGRCLTARFISANGALDTN